MRASLPAACSRSNVACLGRHARDQQQCLGARADAQLEAVARLAHLARDTARKHAPVGQRRPVVARRPERQAAAWPPDTRGEMRRASAARRSCARDRQRTEGRRIGIVSVARIAASRSRCATQLSRSLSLTVKNQTPKICAAATQWQFALAHCNVPDILTGHVGACMCARLVRKGFPMTQQSPFEDIDPTETQEWLESIDSVLRAQGPERAHFLLEKLVDFTRRSGAYLPFKPNTAYLNTISQGAGAGISRRPLARAAQRGLHPLERARHGGAGQPRRTPSTAATSPPTPRRRRCTRSASIISGARAAPRIPGDMVFMQGHSSPGIYARAYLEGRLDEEPAAALPPGGAAAAACPPIRIRG